MSNTRTAKRAVAKKSAPPEPDMDLTGRERIAFHPERWSMGDDEDFEEATGLSVQEAFLPRAVHDGSGAPLRDDKKRPVKRVHLKAAVVSAIVWIEKRHDDPSFTLADARAMTKDTFYLDLDAEPDPKEPAGTETS